jgi:hypothetical protein
MRNRFLILLVLALVFAGLAAGQACAALKPLAGKAACKKIQSAQSSGNGAAQLPCKMTPCQASRHFVFLVTAAPGDGTELRKFSFAHMSAVPMAGTDIITSFSSGSDKVVLKLPPAFKPPPLWTLYCSLLC